jgi:propionate CoA-transferase
LSKILTAAEAAMLIRDGDTIGISAMGLGGWAEEVAQAIEKRIFGNRKPQTFVHPAGIGNGRLEGAGRHPLWPRGAGEKAGLRPTSVRQPK